MDMEMIRTMRRAPLELVGGRGEPHKVDQRTHSDCLRGAVASMLGLEFEDTPPIDQDLDPRWANAFEFMQGWRKWAESRGLELHQRGGYAPTHLDTWIGSVKCWCGCGLDHAVVFRGEDVYWNPSPNFRERKTVGIEDVHASIWFSLAGQGDVFEPRPGETVWERPGGPDGLHVPPPQADHAETTLPVAIGTDTGVGGAVPALGRITIDEDQGQDQFWVIWGIRSKNYSSAASAALFWQAESLTALGTSTTTAGASGASGSGSNVIRNTDLSTNPVAILSTQATGGGAHMSHIGSYRVFARLYRPTGNTGAVSVALEWAESDFRKRTTNDWVDYAADDREGVFTLADLGQVNLSKVVSGTQRWEGRILAKSTVAGDEIDVDYLFFVPVDELSGEASGSLQPQTPTSWSALSTFDTESGAINGDAATVGGNWASTGDATDFSVAAGVATRSEVSDADTNTGRYCASGVAAFAAQTVQIDFKRSASPATFLQGVLARYTDANNWVMFGFSQALGVPLWFFTKRVAGTTSGLAPSVTSSSGFGSWPFFPPTDQYWTLRFSVDAAGRWVAHAGSQGAGMKQLGSGSDSALATGGALASGKPGFYDANTTATACTRTYDNFAAWSPFTDMAMFASQSLQIREDGVFREDSSGAIWSPVAKYEGDLARLPAGGREGRTLETIVKACRNDPYTMSDPGIDDISFQWQYAPRSITTSEPS